MPHTCSHRYSNTFYFYEWWLKTQEITLELYHLFIITDHYQSKSVSYLNWPRRQLKLLIWWLWKNKTMNHFLIITLSLTTLLTISTFLICQSEIVLIYLNWPMIQLYLLRFIWRLWENGTMEYFLMTTHREGKPERKFHNIGQIIICREDML